MCVHVPPICPGGGPLGGGPCPGGGPCMGGGWLCGNPGPGWWWIPTATNVSIQKQGNCT